MIEVSYSETYRHVQLIIRDERDPTAGAKYRDCLVLTPIEAQSLKDVLTQIIKQIPKEDFQPAFSWDGARIREDYVLPIDLLDARLRETPDLHTDL